MSLRCVGFDVTGMLRIQPQPYSSQIQCTRITDIHPAMRDNDD